MKKVKSREVMLRELLRGLFYEKLCACICTIKIYMIQTDPSPLSKGYLPNEPYLASFRAQNKFVSGPILPCKSL